MRIAVRLDDITPDMDYEKFHKMKQLLDACQVKPLIGVVPFNEDKNLMRNPVNTDFADFLQGLVKEGYVVALHGYKHLYSSDKGGIFPLNHFSEYVGVPYETQENMIREGKEQLKNWGVETDIFMAPAHTYDKNTLRALAKNGFSYVTDGFGNKPYRRNNLTFLPIAVKQSDCYRDKEGYTTLVFHTNTMEDKDFERYQKIFEEHKDSFISFGEYIAQKPCNRNFFGRIREYCLATMKHYLVKIRTKGAE